MCSPVFRWVESLGWSACHIPTQCGYDEERVACEDKVGWEDAEDSCHNLCALYMFGGNRVKFGA